MPKVSIIMGAYNVGKVLSESIESILAQTFSDWELIICDDGSKDETYSIAKKYLDENPDRIVLIKNDHNMGLEYTLNRCLQKARGEYIARQDGDDRSHSDRLSAEVLFLERNKEYALVGCNMAFFDDNGIWGKSSFNGEVKKEDFAFQSPFMHPTVLMRREILLQLGGYEENTGLTRVEDYLLWLKFYTRGYKGYNLESVLYDYRDDRNAYSKRTAKNRISLFKSMEIAIGALDLPLIYRVIPIKHLLMIILPTNLYAIIHKLKYKVEKCAEL